MQKLYQKNLLDFIISYYKSIGLGTEAERFFTSIRFSSGIVLNLPAVCIVQKNKPSDSKSKQSHIHVTGDNRLFFYTEAYLNSLTTSTPDIKRPVTVSRANIRNLEDGNSNTTGSLECVETFTLSKVAFRKAQDIQVQLSKTRLDGTDFMDLRNALYTNDLLVFLSYRSKSSDHEFFAVGIPKSFYEGTYEIETSTINHLEDRKTITVKNAIREVDRSVNDDAIISDSEDLADAVYQQMIDLYDETYDLSEPVYEPETYIDTGSHGGAPSTRPNTSPKLGKEAIRRNHYKCIFCTDVDPHTTFIKPNGKPYMEVHHIIPMRFQVNFGNKLDTPANLVSVCPLCHRKLHHGRKEDVAPMLAFLYRERSSLLERSGINITEEDLIDCY